MNEDVLKRLIQNTILREFAGRGIYYFPVAVSARHVHLSKDHFEKLFGQGKKMTRFRELSQPGQFACEETIEIAGPKGYIKKVRVLGPERSETQVEISVSDSFTLGIKPHIRMSGSIAGTPGCTITGPAGKITINQGVIVAARHVHLSTEQAVLYGVKDGDAVSIKTPSPREGIIGNIAVRVAKDFDLEVHLDTDEANGNGILCGTILEACAMGGKSVSTVLQSYGKGSPKASGVALELVTENDVNKALARSEETIYYTVKGFVSPAARDRAKEKGITLCKLQG
ncbi:MAG: phosphate propanoyltransferase [Treponema sp.]|nr:phosphate propanoyltransferase [Treponema sp.]